MPTYEYIALDHTGKQKRGNVVGDSPGAARRTLRGQRLHVKELHPVSESAQAAGAGFSLSKGRRRRDVLEITRQLATMIKANVQLTEALAVLSSQAIDPKLTQVLQSIRDQVLSGDSFADCIKQYPGWFDTIYLSMVRVGEATGNLGSTLNILVEYMAKRQQLEGKIKSALVYPIILVIMCVAVTLTLMTFVVPRITSIIQSAGKQPPAITQFLINTSKFLTDYGWLMVLCSVPIFWLFMKSLQTEKGRFAFDRFKLKIPVIGELIRQSVVARFATTLAALIRSGMPMADSLQVVSEVTGNAVMTRAVNNARERIMAGADVATPLRESGVVDIATSHMISVGERTGELEDMLVSVAIGIEETTDIRVQRISSVIEPVVIVVMAMIVGFIIIATMLPIFEISNIANR